jgi:hypothetical protein
LKLQNTLNFLCGSSPCLNENSKGNIILHAQGYFFNLDIILKKYKIQNDIFMRQFIKRKAWKSSRLYK